MRDECPECGSSNISRNNFEECCRDCGIVLEDQKVDRSREYRAFDESEKRKKERAGGQITYQRHDNGIGSKVGDNGDLMKVPGSKKGKYYRMKKWHRRDVNDGDKAMLQILKKIIADLSLPDMVAEEAGRLVSKAREQDHVQGRNKKVITASIVYLVARDAGVPRTVEETAKSIDVKKRVLGKNYRYIAREMDLGIKPINSLKLIPKYSNDLGVSGETQAEIRDVVKKCRDLRITMGRKPDSVVSGAMYYVSDRDDLGITQREIAQACGVTTVTIRQVSQDIDSEIGGEIEKEVSVKNANA